MYNNGSFGMRQDCCLIPESPFFLEGKGGLYEFIEQRLKENRHMVIVIAEGAGQDYVAQSMHASETKDASGNRLLLDVGLWLTQQIKVLVEIRILRKWFLGVFPRTFKLSFVTIMLQDHFTNVRKMMINMKYIGIHLQIHCLYLVNTLLVHFVDIFTY